MSNLIRKRKKPHVLLSVEVYAGIREALRQEFLARCRRNAAYSLRAFAHFLEIDQSFLSKILNGERRVTARLADHVAAKLGLSESDLKQLLNAETPLPPFALVSGDQIRLLSGWFHFAVLELLKIEGAEANPLHLAQRLGLHSMEVREALTRLERMGFVRKTTVGYEILSPNHSWSNTTQTTEARRQLQRELIEKSLFAIDHIPFEQRENGSLTVAINSKRLPELKEKLKRMRLELAEFLQPEGATDLDEVYQLTMAFFPLTKPPQGGNE